MLIYPQTMTSFPRSSATLAGEAIVAPAGPVYRRHHSRSPFTLYLSVVMLGIESRPCADPATYTAPVGSTAIDTGLAVSLMPPGYRCTPSVLPSEPYFI